MATGWTDQERELDRALCEFCNGAEDHDEPIKANELATWVTFKDLVAAYNGWYEATVAAKGERPR